MKKLFLSIAFILFIVNSNAQQITVQEDFENWPPIDWTIHLLGDANSGWTTNWQNVVHTGTGSAYSSISNSNSDNWLVTPQVSIQSNNYELEFWDISQDLQYYGKISVLISTASGNPLSGDFVEILANDTLNTWKLNTFDLSAYVGQNIYVAFRHEGTVSNTWHKWFLDDVSIKPNTFVDGALTTMINPLGTSTFAVTEDVIVQLKNNGSEIIQNVTLNWEVNGNVQTAYTSSTQNLAPGASVNINLGSYTFNTNGWHDISVQLTTDNDVDPSNDILNYSFAISNLKNAELVGVLPESMSSQTGLQDVSVIIKNNGNNPIDSARVAWSVDGINQTAYETIVLNLNSGESTQITIGQFNFPTGVYEIEATLNVLGDTSLLDNYYKSYAAIDTLWESFESRIFPSEGWSVIFGIQENTNFGYPYHAEHYYTSMPDSNMFGIVKDTLYTPLLNISAGDRFKFYIQTNDFLQTQNSLVWKDGVTGQVHTIEEINVTPNSWQVVDIDISSAAGINYIGISSTTNGSIGLTQFDMITSDAKLNVFNNDLAIIDGEMYILAKKDVNESFTCTIKNKTANITNGADYTVKLMQVPDVELASVNGISIAAFEDIEITVNHTFTNIDNHKLYFEIAYANDQDLTNNTSIPYVVSVVPNTIVINEIGQPDNIGLSMPFNSIGNTNTLGEDDITQSVYLDSDFSNVGNIYGIVYHYDNNLPTNDVKILPVKIWLKQTNIGDLSNGWVPTDEMILVYNDTLEIHSGIEKQIYLPFDTIVNYTGIDNIVIQAYQYNPKFPPAILRTYETAMPSGGAIRTIGSLDVYNLDPSNQPEYYYERVDFPYTSFVIDPIFDYATVSGTVYGTAGIPLNNATVSVIGTAISTQTDVNGNYTLPDLPYGDYDLNTNHISYNDSTISVTLNTANFTQDFTLIERTQVELIGIVYGSNNTTLALENVTVTAEGYSNEIILTDANGNFTLTNIFGVNNYNVTFSLYGYYDTTIVVSVTDINVDMGAIILQQEFISSFDVNATDGTNALIEWKDPLSSQKVKLQNDNNIISYSYTNESNEDVWLGNIFTITDTTTITSVEFRTDIYQNAEDYITIDVYSANDELLASSEPFIVYRDSVHTIDIPNIVVYNDVYVMIHWQNNILSTNSLAIDYSDISIPNTAVIKYPGQAPILFTDFAGGGPDMSFLIRANTLTNGNNLTNNEALTYNVYRGLASEFPNISNWDMINTSPVAQQSYADTDWSNVVAGLYRYAVETIYTDGTSEVTFSNTLDATTTGVEDVFTNNYGISVYPIPANEFIIFEINNDVNSKIDIHIIDITGKVIDMFTYNSGIITERVDVSTYENGIYFMQINTNGTLVTKKFIVKK